MKTHKQLFEEICSFQNLHLAYLKVRKSKRYRPYVLEFNFNLEANLLNLQRDLLSLTYQPGPYCQFIICDSKKRLIKAPDFRDRIVHHALCNIIEPVFDKVFIYDSYACRRGKGTHRAVKRLGKFIKSLTFSLREREVNAKIYCLQCDVSKYFENINHYLLFDFIAKKIRDKKVLWLIKQIIESDSPGVPIGNLTSQLFANIYLNELDQFVKHCLKVKHYLRYMDDFLILDSNKKKLHQIKEQIQKFLKEKLKLELHPKKANIFPIKQGIDFLGYCLFTHHIELRRSTVQRWKKKFKKLPQELRNKAVKDWWGYTKHAKSWNIRNSLKEEASLVKKCL